MLSSIRLTQCLRFFVIPLLFTFAFLLIGQHTPAIGDPLTFRSWALTPPMGWNSYDAFGDTVTEDETLKNAAYMRDHLLGHGWRYVVVDFRWYDPQPTGNDSLLNRTRIGAILTADANGRLLPAVNRFPSSANGAGFKPLADQIHGMGLKFGIHIMRGIPRQAVSAATPIDGSSFTAADAGDPSDKCSWCPDMYGVRDNAAGQAWYDSIFRQYASWGLDFVKVDDLSNPYHSDEVAMIRAAIDKSDRAIVFSMSPGQTPVDEYENARENANMWRISGDFWDRWDRLNAQFDLLAQWQFVAVPGGWPDADMIPFGHIAIRSKMGGDDHVSHFTPDEQQTLMSLWAINQSPLMLGANLPDLDAATVALLTNDELLRIDQDPSVFPARRIWQSTNREIWIKRLSDGSQAVGCFNRGNTPTSLNVSLADLYLPHSIIARDVLANTDMGKIREQLNLAIPAHGVKLLRVRAAM